MWNMPHEIEEEETSLIEFYEFEEKNTISTTTCTVSELDETVEKKTNYCKYEKRKQLLKLMHTVKCQKGYNQSQSFSDIFHCNIKCENILLCISSYFCKSCCKNYSKTVNCYYLSSNMNDTQYDCFDQGSEILTIRCFMNCIKCGNLIWKMKQYTKIICFFNANKYNLLSKHYRDDEENK